jgi:heme exporter protein C
MRTILMLITLALLITSAWLGLIKGTVDPAVKNLVYFHVPSSICSLLCFTAILVCGIGYLASKKLIWDQIAAASAQVGILAATVLNLTGSIFSKAEWGVWWTPEPRLITSAILWFLYVAYLIIRSGIPSPRRRAQICAVFGIIAFLDVPMVLISARLLDKGMHPAAPLFTEPVQKAAFGLSILATILLAVILIWLKTDVERTNATLDESMQS